MVEESLLIDGIDQELARLFETEEGRNIRKCINCGLCTGICVVQDVHPEFNVRRILTMAALGLKDEVVDSDITWLCAHCYYCVVRCPRGVRPAERIFEFKGMAMKKGLDNMGTRHALAFVNSVLKNGKINEAKVTLDSIGYGGLMAQGMFPLKLLMKGKMPKLRKKPMKGMDRLKPIISEILGDGQ